MKRTWRNLPTFGLLVSLIVLAAATSSVSQHRKAATERILVGFISDSACGLKHMPGMGDDKSCTLMCAKNGKFVLAGSDHKVVYNLDQSGQAKAGAFAGQKVRVTGRISGKTIRVIAIEPGG